MRAFVYIISWLVLAGAAGAVELYRWVDEQGVVHYTDQPPPPQVKQERKRFSTAAPPEELPYAMREAARNFPVVLFNADCGDPCTKAAAYLAERGIPATQRDARDPVVAKDLKAIAGSTQVPFMTVGREQVRGYSEDSFTAALKLAGYPTTRRAPSRFPAASAATPSSGAAAPASATASAPIRR